MIIGCDPGVSGAICILEDGKVPVIYDTPKYKTEKGKTDYVVDKMAALLKPYFEKDVTFIIEDVHAMVGNGGVSMFNFGRGKGLWEGIAHAYGFKLVYVSPQTWKKSFEGLIVPRISKEDRLVLAKKEQDKLKRLAKAGAKTKARELAGQLYPTLKDKFVQVNSDGRAEAVLIAHYYKNIGAKNA